MPNTFTLQGINILSKKDVPKMFLFHFRFRFRFRFFLLLPRCPSLTAAGSYIASSYSSVAVSWEKRKVTEIWNNCFASVVLYGITVVADGQLRSYVDVEVPRSTRFMEIITCWGGLFSDSEQSEEDSARVAIKRLRDELGFEVKDVNYDDKKTYKELYERICDEHTELRDEYEMLNLDFDLLKKTYNILIEEKKQIASELKEIMDVITRCYTLVNHPTSGPMDVESTVEAVILGDKETTSTTEEDPEAPPVIIGSNWVILFMFSIDLSTMFLGLFILFMFLGSFLGLVTEIAAVNFVKTFYVE